MPTLTTGTLYGFLLVLTRVAGAFTFVPLPQLRHTSSALRVALSLAVTVALFPVWPSPTVSSDPGALELWILLARMASEALLGAAIGLVVALVNDALALSMQILGVQ